MLKQPYVHIHKNEVDPYLTPHIKNLDFPGIHELFIDYITDFLLSKARPTLDACILGIK